MGVPEDLQWELLVVDNNSSDETREVVESFSCGSQLRPRYVLENKSGLSHARNRGVKESLGDIVSFLDDDVVVATDWLAQIRLAFANYKAVCVGGRVLLRGNPEMPSWWHSSLDVPVGKFDRGEDVIFGETDDTQLIGIGANMSFRRATLEKYGLFDTEMGRIGKQQRTGEETDMVVRLRRNSELVIYYPSAVVYHCISSERFSKRYLRLNAYHFGMWRSVAERERLSEHFKLFGAPLWLYRATLGAAARTVALALSGRHVEAFLQERRALSYLGYWMAARRIARSGAGPS